MIQAVYLVYNNELEFLHAFPNDREAAEQYAEKKANDREIICAVMLGVPVGGTSMPELRALTVFDGEQGRKVFETHAYDTELIPA